MANAASSGAEPMISVTAVGAPWYTSGIHMWNGAAPSLNARPATMNTRPNTSTWCCTWPAADDLEHRADVQRAGGAVDHRQAVQQEAGGHRAEHEVLHRRFGGDRVVAAQRHQRVAGQREQFQAQVDHQEVAARDHHEHAQQREQRQREQLAAAQHVAVGRVRAAVDQADHHRDGGEALEPVAHGVADDHAAEAVDVSAAGGEVAGDQATHGQRRASSASR